ncbi:PIN domain-containing protein [Pantoea sp. UBA6567]|uniref:PIN domain-containing protein n=1 Tax=Pantoea sp. UBA6567 TaxID=1947043 RepID=UPI002598BA36|nr:PIN domain-containing protein [Pantoea sp. UBA6567]
MTDKKYDALLIDTSVYKNYKYKFELGVLKTLSQFKESDIEFIMTDIIQREIISHLNESIHKARTQLESSLQDAMEHLFFDGSDLNAHRSSLLNEELISSLAKKRMDDFIDKCGINVLATEDYAPIKELFDRYFCTNPPFENKSNKKHEFPDAAILLTAEEWAKDNTMSVLAVARDGGWKAFCDDSDYIDYIEELPQALTFFQKDTAPFALRDLVKKDLKDGEDGKLHSRLFDEVTRKYGQFNIEAEANSYLQYENDEAYAEIKCVEFDGEIDLIDSDEEIVTFSTSVEITYYVQASFDFYQFDSVDREYVGMGGNHCEQDIVETATLVFTIQYDLGSDFDLGEIEIADCEVDGLLSVADFGEVEPFRDPSDYHD